jgi:hypothetical protein
LFSLVCDDLAGCGHRISGRSWSGAETPSRRLHGLVSNSESDYRD